MQEVLNNPEYDAPTFWINPEVKDFYDFTVDDFKLIDYKSTKYAGKIPVAV
jgi:thymidylate synthase